MIVQSVRSTDGQSNRSWVDTPAIRRTPRSASLPTDIVLESYLRSHNVFSLSTPERCLAVENYVHELKPNSLGGREAPFRRLPKSLFDLKQVFFNVKLGNVKFDVFQNIRDRCNSLTV